MTWREVKLASGMYEVMHWGCVESGIRRGKTAKEVVRKVEVMRTGSGGSEGLIKYDYDILSLGF